MKWIGKRVSFVDDKQKTTIVIYPESNVLIKGIIGAWVAMWMTIGATIIWSYFSLKLTNQENIIIYIFMTFWVYYAVKVFRSFAWLMWGKELIKIDETALFYKKSVKKYGKSVPYYFENIQKMSLFIPRDKSLQASWEAPPWALLSSLLLSQILFL